DQAEQRGVVDRDPERTRDAAIGKPLHSGPHRGGDRETVEEQGDQEPSSQSARAPAITATATTVATKARLAIRATTTFSRRRPHPFNVARRAKLRARGSFATFGSGPSL